MKKITSLLMTVVLLAAILTVFAVPAFAEDEPMEFVPTYNDEGKVEFRGENGRNYIIRENCEVYKIYLGSGTTLTIPDGVTVEVESTISGLGSTVTIEKGAAVNIGDNLFCGFTLNVCGTMDIANIFDNDETINVYDGTINISTCDKCNNRAVINLYCDGRIIGIESIDNFGVINTLGHTWENGVCSLCGTKGCEIGELDHTWENGVCSVCDKSCDHEWDAATGKCTVCELECTHESDRCGICGKVLETAEDSNLSTGSVLSKGNMTIICTVAAAVVFGLGGFILGTKKKTAFAGGTDNKGDE